MAVPPQRCQSRSHGKTADDVDGDSLAAVSGEGSSLGPKSTPHRFFDGVVSTVGLGGRPCKVMVNQDRVSPTLPKSGFHSGAASLAHPMTP